MQAVSDARASNSELRKFGLILGALFAILFGAVPILRHHGAPRWPWVVAAILWIPALVFPRALAPLHKWWTRIGHAMGWFNTRVILTVIFLLTVAPLGAMMRLFGRDRMKRGFDPRSDSYRVESRRRPPTSMERPF